MNQGRRTNLTGKSVKLTWAALISALMLLAFAPPAPAAPQGPWVLPISSLSAAGQNAFDPQIAIAPDGAATAVWYRLNGTNRIIQTATRPPGGSFGAAVDLSATGQNAFGPQIEIAPDGAATAVWYRLNGTNLIIQTATRPPGGSFGATVDLSATGQTAFDPQIAVAPDGAATAAWTRSNGTNDIIESASTVQPSIPLQIVRAGSGTGTVTSSPAGISCGADCAENYLSFTKVVLTAAPSPGSTFTGWSGTDCPGSGTCEVTLLDATTVTATFQAARLGSLKISPRSTSAKPGSKVTFKVRVKNTGLGIARNLRVCAKAPPKLVKPLRCARAGNLAAGQTKTVRIRATVKRGVKKGNRARLTFTATASGVRKKTGSASIRVR